jgi:RHO1 GDP-GTP exchange protein 1/2
VLMVRVKTVSKREETRVYRKPIPLELLVIAEMGEVIPRVGIAKRPSSSLVPGIKSSASSTNSGQKDVYPITFRHLGKGAYELQLYATTVTQRKKFIEKVEEQQRMLRERNSNFYARTVLCQNFFNVNNRVNCLVPTDGGRKLVYGTDNGVYLADRWPKDKTTKPKRILDASQVSQIDTLEEYRLLLVLSNKTLTSYPFEALDPNNQNPLATRPRKIQGHANFFKAGIGLGRHLVCSVKTSALSTTIKVYEPMDDLTKGKKKPAISKMFATGQDALKPFKVSAYHFSSILLC